MKACSEKRMKVVLDATERIFADETFVSQGRDIRGQMPDYNGYLAAKERVQLERPSDVNVEMLPCWQEPLLTRAQEQHVAKKFNYFKSLARNAALKGEIKRAEQYLLTAYESRELIVLANVRLVVQIVTKTYSDFREDLMSEAYASVVRAVEYFDWRLNNRFSTYATYVISRHLWRTTGIWSKESNRWCQDGSEDQSDLDMIPGRDVSEVQERQHLRHAEMIKDLLRFVDERDQDILKCRFGIDTQPMTLKEIGKKHKVSKERIRQLETIALNKLRSIAIRDSKLELV